MTFKKEVKTGVTLNAFPAIMKKGNSEVQLGGSRHLLLWTEG